MRMWPKSAISELAELRKRLDEIKNAFDLKAEQLRERCVVLAVHHLANRGTSRNDEAVEIAGIFEKYIKGDISKMPEDVDEKEEK